MDEKHWKESALSIRRSRFDDIKEYLAGLAFQAAQETERLILVERRKVSPHNYPDPFVEIKQVFARFFSPMSFQGVRISESPFKYIISTPSGAIDLDDLSDGEKSVFTIAFDIIRRDLQNSIILFDEPEQHLHADLARRFIKILPTLRGGNQFWFTTHSAEILRTVEPDSVYRIAKFSEPGDSQAQRVFSSEDMRQALSDLVGEVGLVTLNRKVVFLEGSGSQIDRYILETLYEDQLDKLRFVSCGSAKGYTRVSTKILDLLSQASEFNFFYAIRDRDFMTEGERSRVEERGSGRLWVWDVYHIENYLLNWPVLLQAARGLCGPACQFADSQQVKETCHRIAQDMADKFLAQRLDHYVLEVFERPERNVDPSRPAAHAKEIGEDLVGAIGKRLSEQEIDDWAATEEQHIATALNNGTWVQLLPGRPILRQLAGELNVRYEQLRNIAVARLKDEGAPQGVHQIMECILD